MAFLRVVEVFPPLFPFYEGAHEPFGLEDKIEGFVEGVRRIRDRGDLFLVANNKRPELLKLSTVEAAYILQDRLKVKAAPVIVARDMNRLQFLSTVVTVLAFGLDSAMIAWGDAYPASARVTNVRDFPSLGDALREVASIRRQASSAIRLLAPVDLNRLSNPRGVAQAKERLRAGADLLLAQPPTTDAESTFDGHSSTLEKSGLKDRVLLNVFPFRSRKDVEECEKFFGWRLPRSLHPRAENGKSSLAEVERAIVRRLRADGFPGVYLSTRGDPSAAETILS